MSYDKIPAAVVEEMTEMIEEAIKIGASINKYDLLADARESAGEFVRYSKVKNEIDELIHDVAEANDAEVETYFDEKDGKTYKTYSFEYFDDSDEDDSDEKRDEIPADDEDEDEESDDIEESDDVEDENVANVFVDDQCRVYIPKNIRNNLVDSYEKYAFLERNIDEIKIVSDMGGNVNLYTYPQVSVKSLSCNPGDRCKIEYVPVDNCILITKA